MITIKTSSWYQPLPDGHIRVGISRGTPRRFPAGYRRYTRLNPGPWFNSCASPEDYIRLYNAEVLDRLDPEGVMRDLMRIADGRIPVLCCFERPNNPPTWCHRSLVSVWLGEALGIVVPEFGYELSSVHPLRPPLDRRPLLPQGSLL